jgi:hypothetical protein
MKLVASSACKNQNFRTNSRPLTLWSNFGAEVRCRITIYELQVRVDVVAALSASAMLARQPVTQP